VSTSSFDLTSLCPFLCFHTQLALYVYRLSSSGVLGRLPFVSSFLLLHVLVFFVPAHCCRVVMVLRSACAPLCVGRPSPFVCVRRTRFTSSRLLVPPVAFTCAARLLLRGHFSAVCLHVGLFVRVVFCTASSRFFVPTLRFVCPLHCRVVVLLCASRICVRPRRWSTPTFAVLYMSLLHAFSCSSRSYRLNCAVQVHGFAFSLCPHFVLCRCRVGVLLCASHVCVRPRRCFTPAFAGLCMSPLHVFSYSSRSCRLNRTVQVRADAWEFPCAVVSSTWKSMY
jgi:hypothetical protein